MADAVKAFEAALKPFHRGNFTAAQEAFDKIVRQYPNQTEILARVNMYRDICKRKLQPPAGKPLTPETLYDYGVLEFNRAHFDAAIDYFERALKVVPQAPHVLYSLAAAQVRSGRTEEGLRTLERAVEVRDIHRSRARRDPDFASVRNDTRFQELVGTLYDSESY